MSRTTLFAGLVVSAMGAHPLHQATLELIQAKASWKPRALDANPLSKLSEAEIRGLMGLIVDDKEVAHVESLRKAHSGVKAGDFPDDFDAREEFPDCMKPIRDQANCGSCWAFATAETFSDNACIAGLADTVFSPQEILDCVTFECYGCSGGRINFAWSYVRDDGLVPDECVPYVSFNGTKQSCPGKQCTSNETKIAWEPVTCSSKMNLLFTDDMVKDGISKFGSVTAGFDVFEDFLHYDSGVYQHVDDGSRALGGHAIKVMGWGVDEAAGSYWWVANSWGDDWGMDGYFKMSTNSSNVGFLRGGGYNCGDLTL